MLRYEITYYQPQHHFIDFTFYIDKINGDSIDIHLPAWRPGRYEIGNFAQNVQQWKAYDTSQKPLPFEKITKDCWRVKTGKAENIIIRYRYYANTLNGGSTFLNEEQLYIN